MKLYMALILCVGCGSLCAYYLYNLFRGGTPTLVFISGAPYGDGAITDFALFILLAGLAYFAISDLWGYFRRWLRKWGKKR